jgi:hypothetical protein
LYSMSVCCWLSCNLSIWWVLGTLVFNKIVLLSFSSTLLRNYSCRKTGGWNVAKWMKLSFPWSTIGKVGVFVYY